MSENVVVFPGEHVGPLPPDHLLQEAVAAKLSGVIIIGYDSEGMLHFTHSMSEPEHIVWLLKCAERETFRALDL